MILSLPVRQLLAERSMLHPRAWLTFFTLIFLLTTRGVSWGQDYFVSPTGNDANAGTTIGLPKLTIQAAVTAASAGNTIQVAAGTYNEQVLINGKNLTINGAGSGSTIIQAPNTALSEGGPDESAFSYYKKNIVEIKGGANVIMTDLKVNGPVRGDRGCGTDAFGIYVYDGASLRLSNAVVSNTQVFDPSTGLAGPGTGLWGCQVGFGIGVGITGQPGSLTINNVVVDTYQKGGLLVRGSGSVIDASSLTVTGVGPDSGIGQNGIQISSGASGTITNSLIRNNDYIPSGTTASGFISFNSGPVTITNTTFSGNDVGIDASSDPGDTPGPVTGNANSFTGNTVANFIISPPASATGSTFVQSVTNVTTGVIFSAIQVAVDYASANDVLRASAGTYDELVTINKSLTIVGQGATSNVTFSGTVPGGALASLFTVAAADVAIQNFGFTVDLSKTHSAIHTTGNDRTNLRVTGNRITSTGTPISGQYTRRNAIAINPSIGPPPGYTPDSDGFGGVVVQSNTVTAGSSGLANSFRAAVHFDLGGGVISGNSFTAINHDVISVFANQGDLTIQNNTCGGGGIQVSDPNPGAGVITVSGNTLDGTFTQPASGTLGTGALMRIRNNGISGTKTLLIQNNTFNNLRWGLSAENNSAITISGNTFNPNSSATDFRHISVNTKLIATNSAALTDPQMQTLNASITGNTFNATSTPNSGTALAFFNHRTLDAKFGSFTVGTSSSVNTFAANLNTFVTLDNSTGASSSYAGPFNDYASASGTNMGPWTIDIDIRNNQFDIGSGLQLPSVFNAAQRGTLETKLFHKPDDATVGRLIYFDPVRNLTQNTGFQTIAPAIAAAATGDIIQLADGYTFNERVVIDKPLTLTGLSKTTTIIDGTGLVGTGSGIVINSGISNVRIGNLTVRNFAGSTPNTSGGIFATLSNNNLFVSDVQSLSNVGGAGFYANGPVQSVTVTNSTFSGHPNISGNPARGIVIWNGFKQNIYIANNTVTNNNCCGIELQDGTASGVTIANNTVVNNGDNGIGVTGLMSGAGPNIIANNTLTDNGRFGIEIKLPNGTGATSGDGSIVVENNTVSRTTPIGAEARDLAGIAVFRRAFVVSENNADIPTGVVVRNNAVSGYVQPSNSDGFGIVIEGTNHTVTGNTVSSNDVGIQQQAGHLPYTANAAVDGDPSNLADQYFGRGNSPVACGNTVSGNTFSGNTTDTRNVGPGVGGPNVVRNTTTNAVFCTIQSAVNAAVAGQSLSVSAGTYPESVTVNKSLTINGANAGINPNTGTRVAETIVVPTTTSADPTSGTATVFFLTASNIVIDGLTVDGNNTALTGGEVINGIDIDGAQGIASLTAGTGHTIQNNIIRNLTRRGVVINPGGSISANALIQNNLFDNITGVSPTVGSGQGVGSFNNGYADVLNNVMTRVRVGVQTNNFNLGRPGGGTSTIANNRISAHRIGIFHNLHYQQASAYAITSNTIAADASSGPTNQPLSGIELSSLQETISATLTNNVVGAGFPRGIESWNTASTGTVLLQGGSVQGTDAGIRITTRNRFGDASPGSKLLVQGVTITGSPVGILVLDDPASTTQTASLTVTGNTNITGTGAFTAVAVSGPDARATILNNSSSFIGNGTGVGVDINAGQASVNTTRISNFATGIRVSNGGVLGSSANNFITDNATTGIEYASDAAASGQGSVIDNSFSTTATGTGRAIRNASAAAITATCNWFGVSGNGALSPNYVSNSGSGSTTFSPFRQGGTDDGTGPSNGFQPQDACSCPPPTVVLSSTNACAGGDVSLSATAGFGTSYTFVNSSNAVIGAGANTTTVSIFTAGTYAFSVLVGDTNGCTTSVGTSVTVEPQPTLGTVTVAPVCEGSPASVTLSGLLASAQQSLSYVIGGGASRTATVTSDASGGAVFLTDVPITAANASQPLTVTAIILTSTGCGQVFNTGTTLQVNTVPAISLGALGSNTLTCNSLVTLTATSGLTTYTFTGPGTIVASGNSATVDQGGSFSVVGTASNGCQTTVATTTVQSDTARPSVTLSGTNVCAGLPIPLSASVTGGTSPFTYTFVSPSPGVVNQANNTTRTASVTGLAAGTYSFTVLVTGANGCTVSTTRSVTVNGNPTIGTITNNSPLCAPGPAGVNPTLTLDANVTPPGTYTYNWSGPGNPTNNVLNRTNSQRNLLLVGPGAAGTYTLVVTTAQGCTASATTTATINAAPTASLAATSFCLQAQPVLTASAGNTNSGDNLQYQLSRDGSVISTTTTTATSLTFAATVSGIYGLTITNLTAGNCSRIATPVIILPGPAAPTISNTTAQLTACAGTAISITAICPGAVPVIVPIVPIVSGFASSTGSNGGTGQYIFTTPSTAGVYAYTVICRNTLTGCLSTTYTPVSATVNAQPTISSLASTSINCVGNTTGSFTVVATGGTAPYTFSANSTTNTNGIFTGLTAGTYPISLTDANGCSPSSVTSVTINQPTSAPTISSSAVTNVLCNGGTGSLTVVATGGALPLNYTLTPGGTANASGIFTGLSVGNYTVTVGDANGCQVATGTLSVTQPAATLAISNVVASSVNCSGTSTGAVSATATGGTAPYTFVLGGVGSSTLTGTPVNFTALVAGTYALTLADANGCAVTQTSITIAQPAALSLSTPTVTTISCSGGSNGAIALTASGGTAGYSYSLNTGASNSTGSFTGLSAGSYTVTVADANGCTIASGSISISGAGLALSLSVTPSSTAVCAGTTVSLTAIASGGTGGYSYTWTGGTSPTNGSVVSAASTPGVGSYTVRVSDTNGCTATETASVTVNAIPTATLAGNPSTTLSCAQPSVTLVAGGGTTYVFTNSSGTPIPSSGNQAVVSAPGIYSVIATSNGCSSTTSIAISQNNVISSVALGTPAPSSAVCVGGSVSVPVGVTNATGLQWYKDGVAVPGQTSATLTLGSIQPSQAGTYQLVATGACNSATTTPGFVLTVNPQPTVTLIFGNNATVMGTGIPTITIPAGTGQSFQVLGGTSFVRTIIVDRINGYEIRQVDSNTTGIFEVNRTGLFTLTVTNGNGCSRTVQGIIVNP